ncbi:hypothetical protein SPSIL_025870 [Sporomusa silvacetica DSM 10669]|uniref:LysE type translocator n=1 Tax=Sporomusa silvacetica DSM 10669 TaxID=1123289 RepID=A0ABZ3IL80_9FIRM|nr:LysE family transporter [Sporomusa silvacetica]OZC23036.1 LysE type translocator [Sporomusa silvacetica DSM 10669]
MLFLIKGIILGFSIAAPIGPIGMLCIRRTLANGMGNGFMAGLGAATADAIYGSIAALGISVVSTFLLEQKHAAGISAGCLYYSRCPLAKKHCLEKPVTLLEYAAGYQVACLEMKNME